MKNKKLKPGEIACRVNIGIYQEDLEWIEAALRTMFRVPEGEDHSGYYSNQERGHYFRQCLMVVSRAIVKAGCKPMPLAVDLRYETPEERAERLGETKPGVTVLENIIVLPRWRSSLQ